MAEGDKRRTPSREVPSTGKMYKTLLETRMANLRLRECSAREGRMYPFGGLDGGTDARRTLGGPINSHQAAGARPKTGLLSGPSSSTTSGRSMLPLWKKREKMLYVTCFSCKKEFLGSTSSWGLSVWSLHVLPVSA
uniref:Uncharacterized protein n=1 Tax=Knipowitschia caucasica TaxID=637954 RepID=A0AAV2JZ30_KNICA